MEIEFFCSDSAVMEAFPPLPAKSIPPDWYKSLPFYLDNRKLTAKDMREAGLSHQQQTIKACIPVKDYINQGYVLRYPSDIMVTPTTVGDESGWDAVSETTKCEPHSHAQCPIKIKDKKNTYFKVTHPWSIKTPKGYSCYFYQPEFLFDENIKFFPGVVDTDSYDHPVNFPGVILSDKNFTLKAGDPMMIVFPFKRDDWSHKVSFREEKKNPVRLFLERGYQKLFNQKKKFS